MCVVGFVCQVLGGAPRLFLKRASTQSRINVPLTISATSVELEPAAGFGSAVFLSEYGRGSASTL